MREILVPRGEKKTPVYGTEREHAFSSTHRVQCRKMMSNITLHLHQSQMMQVTPLPLVHYKYNNMPLKLKKLKKAYLKKKKNFSKADFS
jgi:hypothetical protein